MKIIHLFLLSLLACQSAFAGQETHGGDVLQCAGKAPVVLDYYHASLPSLTSPIPNLVDIDTLSADGVINIFRQRLAGTYMGDQFERAYQEIGDYTQWVLVEGLYDENDEGLPFRMPPGCSLVQAALRVGHSVYVNPEISRAITPAQLGVLVGHEIFYKLAVEKGMPSSATTRHMIRALLQKVHSPAQVAAAAHAMNWGYSWFEGIDWSPNKMTAWSGDEGIVYLNHRDLARSTGEVALNVRGYGLSRGSLRCAYDGACEYTPTQDSAPDSVPPCQFIFSSLHDLSIVIPGKSPLFFKH
jgi:hypothetical protein